MLKVLLHRHRNWMKIYARIYFDWKPIVFTKLWYLNNTRSDSKTLLFGFISKDNNPLWLGFTNTSHVNWSQKNHIHMIQGLLMNKPHHIWKICGFSCEFLSLHTNIILLMCIEQSHIIHCILFFKTISEKKPWLFCERPPLRHWWSFSLLLYSWISNKGIHSHIQFLNAFTVLILLCSKTWSRFHRLLKVKIKDT